VESRPPGAVRASGAPRKPRGAHVPLKEGP